MRAPIVIHFKGGSLGGETQVRNKFELCSNSLRVPVYVGGVSYTTGPSDAFAQQINYSYDEYRVERYLGENEVEMRWVRPKDLSGELARVKAELAEAQEVMDSLKKLKKFFKKLDV